MDRLKQLNTRWVIVWQSKGESPTICFRNCLPLIFRTKKEAKACIDKMYAHLNKPEFKYLRKAPTNWRLPKAKKANITFDVLL